MSVSIPGLEIDEELPTVRLSIIGAEIEPWTSKLIKVDPAFYMFRLNLSRPVVPGERIVFKEERGVAGPMGYTLGKVVARKLRLRDDHIIVGALSAAGFVAAAPLLNELVLTVARKARERSAKAQVDWQMAKDRLPEVAWSDGSIAP